MKKYYKKKQKTYNEIEHKICEVLKPTGAFYFNSLEYDGDGNYTIKTRGNYVVAVPKTMQTERDMKSNPFIRSLSYKDYYFAIFFFPSSIKTLEDRNKLDPKYKARIETLINSHRRGQIALQCYLSLPMNDFMKLKYTCKKCDDHKDHDFKDYEDDTLCKKLNREPKTYETIDKVSLTYNTLLILHNAKENKNKSLFYYLKAGTQAFYTDCIINYVLEHGNMVAPENFKYEPILEVRMPVRELRKLYPHRSFKLVAPEGVTITYQSNRKEAERQSKNDIAVFRFTEEYIAPFKNIIKRSDNNSNELHSFIKVPIFFVLQALKQENLTSGGFNFLLWFITYFRMQNPRILHSLKNIMLETGMDVKHGHKKPLKTLTSYFNYLFKVNTLSEVKEPLVFTRASLNEPPKNHGNYISIKKPKKNN